MTNYHTRASYEQLYGWLQRDTGRDGLPVKEMNDQDLLMTINYILIQNHCIPLSIQEIKKSLQ